MKRTNNPKSELRPSLLEVQEAKTVFLKKLQKNRRYTWCQPGTQLYMSPKTAVACALMEVWRQSRMFQRNQDLSTLLELTDHGTEVGV